MIWFVEDWHTTLNQYLKINEKYVQFSKCVYGIKVLTGSYLIFNSQIKYRVFFIFLLCSNVIYILQTKTNSCYLCTVFIVYCTCNVHFLLFLISTFYFSILTIFHFSLCTYSIYTVLYTVNMYCILLYIQYCNNDLNLYFVSYLHIYLTNSWIYMEQRMYFLKIYYTAPKYIMIKFLKLFSSGNICFLI